VEQKRPDEENRRKSSMNGKQLFTLLGAVAIVVYVYQRFLSPRCTWCGAALQILATGQTLACPSCGRIK
jgi:hypothetical protein